MKLGRRGFLQIAGLGTGGLFLPRGLQRLQEDADELTAPVRDDPPSTLIQVIGDTHIDHIDYDRLGQILADVPEIPAQIVQVGDLTDIATSSQDSAAIAFLTSLPIPPWLVCGGHDVWDDNRTPEQWASTYGMPGPNYVADGAGVRLIILGVNGAALPQALSAEQLEFLDISLQEFPETPCLIFCHQPLYYSVVGPDPVRFYDSTIRQFHTHEDAAIRSVLARHDNAKAWISGHTHSPYFADGFVKLEQVGTHHVLMVNASSPYNTDKVQGETPDEPIVTIYLTVAGGEILARVRDHLTCRWIKQELFVLQTGLPEPAVMLSDPFSKLGNRGSLEIYDDNTVIGMSGGLMRFTGTPTTTGQGTALRTPLLRKCGRAVRFDVRDIVTLPAGVAFGMGRTKKGISDIEIGFDYAAANIVRPFYLTTKTGQITLSGSAIHSFICAMRSHGGLLFGRNSTDPAGQYTLLHVYGSGDGALYAAVRLPVKALNFNSDNLWIGDMGFPLSEDWQAAILHIADTLDNESVTCLGNGWFEHTYRAQAGTVYEIMFRRADDLNTWIARLDIALGEITFWSRSNGIDTLRGGPAAFPFLPEVEYRILIYCNGNIQRLFIDDVYRAGANSTSMQTNTGLKVSHAGRDLAVWPLTLSIP